MGGLDSNWIQIFDKKSKKLVRESDIKLDNISWFKNNRWVCDRAGCKCNKFFKSKTSLIQHIRKRYLWYCVACGTSCSERQVLKKHLQTFCPFRNYGTDFQCTELPNLSVNQLEHKPPTGPEFEPFLHDAMVESDSDELNELTLITLAFTFTLYKDFSSKAAGGVKIKP